MKTRWTCPNAESTGCPGVLAPTKPRRDDVRRYCLACSAKTGRLVARVSPALEAKRAKQTAKKKLASSKKQEKEQTQEAAYYQIAGVDVRAEIWKLWGMPIARDLRLKLTPSRAVAPPKVDVRNRQADANRFGVAFVYQHRILINRIPGHDAHTVRETCAHELAHILTPGKGHGVAWKTAFRLLCEQAYGVRPRVEERFIGETHAKMRAAASEAKRIQHEIETLGPEYSEDGIVRTVLRERVTQEVSRAAKSAPSPDPDCSFPGKCTDPNPREPDENCKKCHGWGVFVVGAEPEIPCPVCMTSQ